MDQLASGIHSHKLKCFNEVSELLACLSCLRSRDKHLCMATLPISNHTLKKHFLSTDPRQSLGWFGGQTSVILTEQTQWFLICMSVLRAYSPDLYVYEKSDFFLCFLHFQNLLLDRKLSLPINSVCAASSEARADASSLSHSAANHSMNRRNI